LTSSASITGWCVPGDAPGPGWSPSSPAGPHARRPSTPATGSASSRTGPGCWRRPIRSCGKSTASCAAGPDTSGTATRPANSTRSAPSPWPGSRCSWPSATNAAGPGDAAGGLPGARPPRADLPHRNRRRPPARPGMAGPSRMPPVKDVGEPCAGEPHARSTGGGWKRNPRVTAPAAYPTAPAQGWLVPCLKAGMPAIVGGRRWLPPGVDVGMIRLRSLRSCRRSAVCVWPEGRLALGGVQGRWGCRPGGDCHAWSE